MRRLKPAARGVHVHGCESRIQQPLYAKVPALRYWRRAVSGARRVSARDLFAKLWICFCRAFPGIHAPRANNGCTYRAKTPPDFYSIMTLSLWLAVHLRRVISIQPRAWSTRDLSVLRRKLAEAFTASVIGWRTLAESMVDLFLPTFPFLLSFARTCTIWSDLLAWEQNVTLA